VKVTVPEGERSPAVLAVTVAVNVTARLTFDGLRDDISTVWLLPETTVWVTMLLLLLKLPSPL
jgi:hypothetical protein